MIPIPPVPRPYTPRLVAESVLAVDLPDAPAPGAALGLLRGLPGRVLLESGGSEGSLSILAADPVETLSTSAGNGSDPFTGLADLLARYRMPAPPDGIHFAGGIVGYLGYETGDYLERLPPPPPDDLGLPDAWFGVYDVAVQWDRRRGRCTALAAILPGRTRGGAQARLEEILARLSASDAARPGESSPETPGDAHGEPESSLSRAGFKAGVETVQRYIRAGDLFQANLTRRISVATSLSGPELYRALVAQSPAPFAAFVDTGQGEVASISPELFLSVRGQSVCTAPIKGTTPRGSTAKEDARLRSWLEESAKDRAENVMIVDLLRNDLSRVCLPGSVGVPRLAEIESHPTVHHLVSTVTGTLSKGMGIAEVLRATFPGGSVTGAPKIRAMEILRELEPVRRGVYTGALGILGFHGDAELSVAIRTAVLKDGRAHYGTGGGITLGSDPEAEWRETEDKALAFFRALRATTP